MKENKVTELQFAAFSKLFDSTRSGEIITLYRSDYWLRQAGVLDDRGLTTTDTGLAFFKHSKTELTYEEWCEMLSELCAKKNLDKEDIINRLTNCNRPEKVLVNLREFRSYFKTYEPKNGFVNIPRSTVTRPTMDSSVGLLLWVVICLSNIAPTYGLATPHYAFRRCGLDGKWAGRHSNDTNPNGWTNYTPCFPPVVQSLFFKVYNEDESHAQTKFDIADITRTIEIIGFTLSFITLSISLFILNKYRSLNNLRTRIHKNLFTAMNAQVILRLIVYIDQAIMRRDEGKANYKGISAIESVPSLCISTYVLLEYFITVMFMWMLCEGMYLNTIVANNVLKAKVSYRFFCLVGWLLPMLITAAWSALAGVHYAHATNNLRCWYGYNFQTYFWTMQGPRLSVILINLVFLLNIMRVLVLKLREDTTSDIVRTRKAVKAAMVLLPLLGITNILGMFEGPVAGPLWQFAAWSYTSHTMRSFQGAVLAWLYCLGTAEIQAVLSKSYSTRLAIFRHRHPRLAYWLGLRRKRRIQRFPRQHPELSTSRRMARLETLALCELTHVQTSQQTTDNQDITETDYRETTTAEVHRRPVVRFADEPITHVFPCDQYRTGFYTEPEPS